MAFAVQILVTVAAVGLLGCVSGQQFQSFSGSLPNRFFRVSTTSNEIISQPERFFERLQREFGIPAQQIAAAALQTSSGPRTSFQLLSQNGGFSQNARDPVVLLVSEEAVPVQTQRPQPQSQFQQVPVQQFESQTFQQTPAPVPVQQNFVQQQQFPFQQQVQEQQFTTQQQVEQQQFTTQQFPNQQQVQQQQQQFIQQPQNPPQVNQLVPQQQAVDTRQDTMTEACLACICQASTSCNLTTECIAGGAYCGPFLISKPYWIDAGQLTLVGDSPGRNGAFEDCAADPVCSADTVRSYMTKHSKDCNGDGKIDCDDLGRIHLLGYYGCADPSVVGKPFYQRFNQCFVKASRLSRTF